MKNREKLLNLLSNETLAKLMYESKIPIYCGECPAKDYCNSKRIDDPDEPGETMLPDGENCETVMLEWLSKDN